MIGKLKKDQKISQKIKNDQNCYLKSQMPHLLFVYPVCICSSKGFLKNENLIVQSRDIFKQDGKSLYTSC